MKIRKLTRSAICLYAGLLLTGCAAASGGSQAGAALTAWIDAPLDGSAIPLRTYPVVIHGTDPNGVAQLELSIAGAVVLTAPNPDPASLLVHAAYSWTPPAPGRYTLRARTQNTAGVWSGYAQAEVTVLPDKTPTPTATPTPEARTGAFTEPAFSPGKLAWANDCGATKLSAKIGATDPDGIKALVLFYRLENTASGARTAWADVAMNPVSDDQYSVVIRPGALVPALDCALGEVCAEDRKFQVQVQFVIQDMLKEMTRSKVFIAASLQRCLP